MRRPKLATVARVPHTIRFRLTLWYTGLVAVVLAVFVGGVFIAFSNYHFNSFDQDLVGQLQDTLHNQLVAHVFNRCPVARHPYPSANFDNSCIGFTLNINDPSALSSGGMVMQYYTSNLQRIPGTHKDVPQSAPALNSALAKTQLKTAADRAKKHTSSGLSAAVENGERIVTIPLSYDNQYIIGQVAVPMTHAENVVDALKHILVYIAAVLLAISAVGGWILAGRALKPIDDISRRARQITVHDLSQRINLDLEDEVGRMAATFDDMIARLEEAFERQKRFTSDASHELRTPLTVMQADLGLALARPRSADDYRRTLLSMDDEVTRLSTIVNDLLMLTRIDIDPAGMQHQPVALNELLAGLCRRVRVIAVERDIAVVSDRLDPITILGDATRLRQLFTNLLDNAVTYTRPQGVVTVRLTRTRDGARVQVQDTGIGIGQDNLPRIFERFYRTSEAREHNTCGTGLGLAISRSVVQAHNGVIDVHSVLGEGTTFTVTLPRDGRKPIRRVYGLRALVPSAVAT